MRRTYLSIAVLMTAAVVTAPADSPAEPLSAAAVAVQRPAGAPRLGDVCFSSRWPRPLDKNDPHDTFAAARLFRASRFDWNYPGGAEFVREVKRHGFGYFGTISAELEGTRGREGRDKSFGGNIVGNPELDFLAARGDVNSDAYREVVLRHVRMILEGGADGIFVDDPGMTYHNARYNKGGFGDASMQKFPSWLVGHSTPAERAEWNLPGDLEGFDYAAYVRGREGRPPAALEELFFEFHRQSVDDFYQWLRAEADRIAGRRVPFACNNWSLLKQDEFPFREHFEFWIGETSVRNLRPTARLIDDKVRRAQSLGKMQCFSPPNDGTDVIPTREEYVALTRKIIATSYACGSVTLVPWDVWRRGTDTPRFFGTADEFAGLYSLVAENRKLFDGHEEVFASGADIAPRRADGVSERLLRAPQGPPSLFMTVRAVPGDPRAAIVIHLVDWSDRPRPFALELENASFGGQPDAALNPELLVPGKKPERLVGGAEGGITTVRLPALAPGALLVLHPRASDAENRRDD